MKSDRAFANFQAYLESLSPETQEKLKELRECILKAVPGASELMNYNLPAFALVPNGKRDQQVMIAGYKNHVGLYPHPTAIEHFEKELERFKVGKGSIQFPLDKPLPRTLIGRIVKYRWKLLNQN